MRPRQEAREAALVVAGVLATVVVPTALHGWPTTLAGTLFTALLAAAGVSLVWWRSHPQAVAASGGALFLAAAVLGRPRGAGELWFPDPALLVLSALALVLALAWSGRRALVAALCLGLYLVLLWYAVRTSYVALAMFTLPAFAAGTAFRLRRETADELAVRAEELEEERELYAGLVLRHERARIAAELHDIVGHAISVMVIQAAAGQRLVDADPERAEETFAVIAETARRGKDDLERLVELLGGTDTASEPGAPDLSLVDEVVARAGRTGLRVTCRFEGDRAGLPAPVEQLAFRVVQESLTNALRHAPGAQVRIAIVADPLLRSLDVRVENDGSAGPGAPVAGTGRGLVGLRERVQALGGRLVAGPGPDGGWAVQARLTYVTPST